jgi:adenosylhomocysteine nucleosidase
MSQSITAIIGAMEEEIERIREELDHTSASTHAGITFYEGSWHGCNVVLCKSGVGKVNAAVCTQLLVERFHVTRVIFTGVAGAVEPSLNIGDLVISTECIQHDVDVTALGFARGVIPYSETSSFPADDKLVQLAYQASEAMDGKKQVWKGRVLSGDQFIADKEHVKRLFEEFQGACIEMEGAAVAQVCAMNRIPYVVIRSISDKADGSAHVNFAEFTKLASLHSYQLVSHMIQSEAVQ